MSPRAWEEYLYEEHQAFAVSPFRGLQLFDVLVKTGGNNLLSPGPVKLCKIDSFVKCGLRNGSEDDLGLVDKLDAALQKFKKRSKDPDYSDESGEWDARMSDGEEERIISRQELCSLEETIKANSNIFASLMKFVNLQSKSSNEVTCKLTDAFRYFVDGRALGKVLDVWKPDMKLIAKHGNPVSRLTGRLQLWLITEILFAEEVIIDGNSSKVKHAEVQAGQLLGGAMGVPSSTGGKIGAEQSKAFNRELTGGNIPFAIRTTLLTYDCKGELVGHEDGAKVYAVVRGSSDNKFCDPVKNPTYNIGDLFENGPMNNPDEEYIPLEFDLEDAEDAEESALQDSQISDLNSNI